MLLSEIIPSSIKIDKLLNRIGEGDIKIPAFQRGFVWNQDQVLELIDSIYNLVSSKFSDVSKAIEIRWLNGFTSLHYNNYSFVQTLQ